MKKVKLNLIEIICMSLSVVLCVLLCFVWLVYPIMTNKLNTSMKITAPIHNVRTYYYNPGFEIRLDDDYPEEDFITNEILSKNLKAFMDNYNISISCDVTMINNSITPLPIKNIEFNGVMSDNDFDQIIISPKSYVTQQVDIDFVMTTEVFEYISQNYEEKLKTWLYHGDPTREPDKMLDYIENRMALISTLVGDYYVTNKPNCNIELCTQYNKIKTYSKEVEVWKGDMYE